jgi:hypothetical protein
LKVLANTVYRELNVVCISYVEDPNLFEKILLFIDAQIKNFFHINPRECIEDIDCVSKILNIHREVFSLTTRRKYIIK